MSTTDPLTACECCQGVEPSVPVQPKNRPGLAAIEFRAGTHGSFLESMLAAIAGKESLRELGARTSPDFTISLMDSWAVALDVLTFYQERFANESFLGTAVERRSILELAALIGYKLRPGLAASVPLAFFLDSSKGSPAEVLIPERTAAQSIPSKEEVPQTFETVSDLLAKPRWNELRPRLTTRQEFSVAAKAFYVSGVSTNLRQGDPVLVVANNGRAFDRVAAVRPEPELSRTLLLLSPGASPPAAGYDVPPGAVEQLAPDSTLEDIIEAAESSLIDASSIQTALAAQGESIDNLIAAIRRSRGMVEPPEQGAPGLYALRASVAPFGHNAPGLKLSGDSWVPQNLASQSVTKDSSQNDYGSGDTIYLDQEVKGLLANDWVVLSSRTTGTVSYQVASAAIESRADFGISGKATRLKLKAAPGGSLNDLPDFLLRETSVHLLSEFLPLSALPVESIDAGTTILELEDIVPDLPAGRSVILSGEPVDLPGVTVSEELMLDQVAQGRYTTLYFKNAVQFSYARSTVRIYGNVAPATHGESKAEILGSGDASQPFQSFTLKFSPLTWVSSPESPTGAVSTIEVRAGGIRWTEAATFFGRGPNDRIFTLQIDNDAKTAVKFGDGLNGARLPSGSENVTAVYRYGLGAAGLVGAERITLLPRKPLGVRSVLNPIASAGAQDPETIAGARASAPLTVRTLDRIVSLFDFEDFARAFSGVGKARAEWLWDGARRLVHVTVAGPDGEAASDVVLANLIAAMDGARVPHQPVRVSPFERLYFKVIAGLTIHPDYDETVVLEAAEASLRDTFSFAARQFAQRAAKSEVYAALQRVAGVVAVDLDELSYDVSDGGNTADSYGLPARGAAFDTATGEILPAQLLLVTPGPIELRRLL